MFANLTTPAACAVAEERVAKWKRYQHIFNIFIHILCPNKMTQINFFIFVLLLLSIKVNRMAVIHIFLATLLFSSAQFVYCHIEFDVYNYFPPKLLFVYWFLPNFCVKYCIFVFQFCYKYSTSFSMVQ